MKRRLGCVIALAFGASCSTVHTVEPEDLRLPPIQFPLLNLNYPSGLRVLVEHDARTPLAGVFLVVGSGSTSDPIGKEGLAHYIEHLTFRSRPTAKGSYDELLDRAGVVTHNAFTDRDYTAYYELGLASHLTEMLQLEGRRMMNPIARVSAADRTTELDVVRNEVRQRGETGYVGEVIDYLSAAIFPPGTPYGRSVGGSMASLAKIERADVDAYVREHYKPENMTLLILGDVDLAQAEQLVASGLPLSLREADPPVRVPKRMPAELAAVPEEPPASPSLVSKEASVATPEIWVAWSLPPGFNNNDYLSAFVPGFLRGGLLYAMSKDKDITNISVNILPGVQASMLVCRIDLRTGEHAQDSLDAVLGELKAFWEYDSRLNYGEERGFGVSRRSTLVFSVAAAQNLAARGIQRAIGTHFSGDPATYTRAVTRLTDLRLAEVRAYGSPFITRERARAILFKPQAATALSMTPGAAPPVSTVEDRAPGGPPGWEMPRLKELLEEPRERSSYRLPNGLKVILEPRRGLPVFTASILFPAVAANREESAAAIAASRGGPRSARNGSPVNVGASFTQRRSMDSVAHSIEGASGNVELLIAMLAEAARTFQVSGEAFSQFESFGLAEVKRSEAEPLRMSQRSAQQTLFTGSPYASVPGSHELDDISLSDARAWVERTHSPGNATVVLAGEFDPKAVVPMLAASFGDWQDTAPARVAPAALTVPESASAEVQLQVTPRKASSQSQLSFGCITSPALDSLSSARHQVSAQVLNQRLYLRLRVQLGATYGTKSSAITLLGGTSYFLVEDSVETAKLGAVLSALGDSLRSLRTEPPTEAELAWARVKLADEIAASRMTNAGLISDVIQRSKLGFPFDGPGRAAELEAVTPEQVRGDWQSCMKSRPTLSLVGDEALLRSAFQSAWHP